MSSEPSTHQRWAEGSGLLRRQFSKYLRSSVHLVGRLSVLPARFLRLRILSLVVEEETRIRWVLRNQEQMNHEPKVRLPGEEGSARPLPPNVMVRRALGLVDRAHPLGGEMSDVLRGLLLHLHVPWLVARYSQVAALAPFSFLTGCLSIGLMSGLAAITNSPFVFPSLGPTAFLFFYTPTAPSASPRNTLAGHAIGIGAGYLSLVVTGLTQAGPAFAVGVTWPRIIANALSLGLTSGVMVLLRVPHPPAGATALIISLGLLARPWQLGLLMGAVVLLTLQALIINRLAGIPYPLWGPLPPRVEHVSERDRMRSFQQVSLFDWLALTIFLGSVLALLVGVRFCRSIKSRKGSTRSV